MNIGSLFEKKEISTELGKEAKVIISLIEKSRTYGNCMRKNERKRKKNTRKQ